MIFHGQEHVHIPQRCMPLITAQTLAAKGSKMNPGTVISNMEIRDKSLVQTDALFPKAALADPKLTLSYPQKNRPAMESVTFQSLFAEAYLNGTDGTPVQDESALPSIGQCQDG